MKLTMPVAALCILMALPPVLRGAVPDHPIITEVFNNPSGSNDGPTGRDPTNDEQEFVEIYLPSVAELNVGLSADALRLTYYEIEGDSGNSDRGSVNQRFDLPMFDLDPSNGLTPGAVPRPANGIVILGWVDYNAFDPPTDLLGTPSTRVGLINGGITSSPAGTVFVAMNGAEFTGTANFPVPVTESLIEVPNENANGVMRNGSNVYLLVNRDDGGYVSLSDRSTGGDSYADLPGGGVLGLSSLLDGIAGNDDSLFVESAQPYVFPTGSDIDLEDVLPAGGAFSLWVAQIAEGSGGGYARRYVDVLRTTEDGIGGNEDPATDATGLYRRVFRTGPFYPTPGSVVFSSDAPKLAVPLSSRLAFSVLANTTGRPGLLCANVGGDWPIDVSVTPGGSSNPAVATFAVGTPASGVPGQAEAYPQIAASVDASAPNGAIVMAPVTFTATNSSAGDPTVQDASQMSVASVTALNPTRAVDELGAPIETTVFLAVEGFGADPGVANEFVLSELADYVSANLGGRAEGTLGTLDTLLNPATNLEDITVVDPLRQSFPSTELEFIDAPGPSGTEGLAATVVNSAKVRSGSTAYADSINTSGTAIRAIELAIPETYTTGGTFSTGDVLYFAEANGGVYESPRNGLNEVTTSRTFELAIIDTNVTSSGIESGDADDFGLIVEVGRVAAGASVVPGQFLFLSYTGGLEGEDIDTLDIPGTHATVAVLLDLDNLSAVLGAETITRLFVIDADVGGTVNVMEAISLNKLGCLLDTDCADGNVCTDDTCVSGVCQYTNNTMSCDDGNACTTGDQCDGTGQCVGTPVMGCVACDPPEAIASGSRYITVTPSAAATSVALEVIGDPSDPAVACVSRYVQTPELLCVGGFQHGSICQGDGDCPGGTCNASAILGPTLVRLTPAEWGTVHVRGSEILPGTVYHVQADCGTEPGTVQSTPVTVETWLWGDVNHDARCQNGSNAGLPCNRDAECPGGQCLGVGFADINTTVNGYKGAFGGAVTMEATDLAGCVPNRDANFIDIAANVDAYKTIPFSCGAPCAP